MRTFIAAKIGLLPFVLFWALAASAPQPAISCALGLSIAVNLWRWRRNDLKQVEVGGLALFAFLAAGLAVAPAFILTHALAFSFFALALVAFISLGRKKPWTADYAAAEFSQQRESPIFIGINKALSSLWMTIFLGLGLLAWFGANPLFAAALTLAGVVASIFGPDLQVRAILSRKLATQCDFDWPAPRFGDPSELDVAVIGAGIGGLTAACLLAAQGLRVKIFEQHVLPGGFCHSWLRKTRHEGKPLVFRFDAGPHDFSGAHKGGTLDRLLQKLGCAEKIDWRRVDYRMIDAAGESFDPPRDPRAHAEALALRHPADAEGVKTCFEILQAIFVAMQDTAPESGFMGGGMTSVDAMLAFAKKHPLYPQWAESPYVELVSRYVKTEAARNSLLAIVGYISEDFSRPTCADMAPIHAYFINGGYYPRGGTSCFSDVLADAFRARGGEIAFKTGVKKILVEQGRAAGLLLDNGETIRARAVIANCDPRKTFLELIDPENLPEAFRKKLEAAPPATSGFGVHLGVKGEPEGLPLTFVAGEPACLVVLVGKVDPSDAPSGYSTVDLFTLLDHEQAQKWFPEQGNSRDEWEEHRNSGDYERRKQAVGDLLISQAEKAIPGLRDRIVFRCEASPITYARYDWSSAGAIYGIAPEGRMRGAKSPIPGLVVAGAMNFGPGVEAVALSGVWAAEALSPGASFPPALAVKKSPLEAVV
jgi:phytoene dehydrogenase-like protein